MFGFKDFVDGRGYCYDDNGHGTHVTGIICSNGTIKGIAPDAQVAAIKVLDREGNGKTNRVLQALEWIQEYKKKYAIRILNFSVGFLPGAESEEQKLIVDKLEQLWDDNMIVVAAAGNNGPGEGSVTVPGISRKIITVGANDDKNPGRFMPKAYSGQGPTECCIVKPEILAPGTNMISLDRNNHYVRKSGTSMATPVVSGAIALALQKNPGLRPEEIKLKLYESVEKNEGMRGGYTKAWGNLHVDNLLHLI